MMMSFSVLTTGVGGILFPTPTSQGYVKDSSNFTSVTQTLATISAGPDANTGYTDNWQFDFQQPDVAGFDSSAEIEIRNVHRDYVDKQLLRKQWL